MTLVQVSLPDALLYAIDVDAGTLALMAAGALVPAIEQLREQ